MVVRGRYTKAERKMLSEWQERSDRLTGWLGETPTKEMPYPVSHRVATKELILHMAYAADYWNLLWRDEDYARNTRWGGIIAPPFFQHCISHGGARNPLEMPPEDGIVMMSHDNICDRWEFFKPIHVNDSFKVWNGPGRIEDITKSDKDALRTFKNSSEMYYINQKDEVTCSLCKDIHTVILPPEEKTTSEKSFTKEYVYTEEEIAAIDHAWEAEEIRGAKPRFWEDVKIGDELKPVVMGPITTWDTVVEMQGFGVAILPMREVRRQTPERVLIDPQTNIPHKSIEFHLTETGGRINQSYSTTILGVTTHHFLGRLITNWMGDDGFLRKFQWRKLHNAPLGDTIFGRGKVIKKYVDDNGDYMVDLDTWMETIRGYIPNVGTATVNLPSKEKLFKPLG
jgi:hypothetical protein